MRNSKSAGECWLLNELSTWRHIHCLAFAVAEVELGKSFVLQEGCSAVVVRVLDGIAVVQEVGNIAVAR